MRELVNKYGAYIAVSAIVICVPIYLYSAKRSGARMRPQRAYFVDEETMEESVGPAPAIPPLPGKSGRATVVKAVKLTSDGGRSARLYYLEKYTPEAQKQLQNMAVDDPEYDSVKRRGLMMRSPEPGSPWVPGTSNEADDIRANTGSGGVAREALPP